MAGLRAFIVFIFLFISHQVYGVNDSVILADKFPKTLSEFAFFDDNKAQDPSNGVLPYELISTLFSDYSYKQRWVYVPRWKKSCL